MTETNEEVVVDTTNNEGEGNGNEVETITIPRKEYDEKVSTIGSMKRELKDLKKPKETVETPKTNQKPEDNLLQRVERLALKTAGIDHLDDIELARKTAQKWGMEIEDVLGDEDFKVKLERQQTSRANVTATSNVRGNGSNQSQAKTTPEYWLAKGQPPTPADVPDRKTRQAIISAFLKDAKGNGEAKFYNS